MGLTGAAPRPCRVGISSPDAGGVVAVGASVPIRAAVHGVYNPGTPLGIFCATGGGVPQALALTRGGRCTMVWTPARPGLYRLSASARYGRRAVAYSRPLNVLVSVPPAPVRVAVVPPPADRLPPKLPRPARRPRPTGRRAARPATRAVRPAARQNPVIALPPLALPPRAPHALAYHVLACLLPGARNAATLADALRRRGYHARVYPVTGAKGTRYAVEAGVRASPQAAQADAQALRQTGYPAGVLPRPR